MKMYLGSINDQVWDVTESDYVILDLDNLTNTDKVNKQCNTIALNTIYNAIDSMVFEQIKDCERASEVWKRLKETYEDTPVVKSAKLYILKDKLTSLKMKDDESIPEMFHRLQVIINDLKALGDKINDYDVSYRFLMCLPLRFKMLRLLIIRGGLKEITPNQVLGDVMTQETYHVERAGVDKDEKKEDEDKKKSVAFKVSSSSKNKGKSKKESSDDEDTSDIDDDAIALFVHKMGKFIKKKGYGARKRSGHNKECVRRRYECKRPDHVVANCPYNSDNDEDEKKKKRKKEKKEKEKKEKKMTFQKKKGGGYVVT
jgi:hypothetical protein